MAVDWKPTRDAAHALGDGWGYWLLDKQLEPIADLHGVDGLSYTEAVNDTTTCLFEFPENHPAVRLLLPLEDIDPEDPAATWTLLVDEAQYIMLEGPGGHSERLVYRVARIIDKSSGTVSVEGKSLYRYVEKIACRADPGSSLIFQLKYRDYRAGDSLRVLKEYLLVNLMRDFQPRAITGWDLWASANWAGVTSPLWPAMVSPIHQSTTTQNCVLDARFDMAADLFGDTLNAAGLMLTVDLWLPGDPQPAPDHVTLTEPTIWIDIVTRQFDTSTTGGAMDFFRGLIRSFDVENNAPVLGLGDTPATAAGRLPWVVWRPKDMARVTSDLTVVKSEDWHVTVGGRSPEVINKLLGAGSKALFQGLAYALAAMIPVFGPLIVAAGIFLGEVVGASLKDKLFAWQDFSHAVRKAAHGKYAYRDQVAAGDGWTLSAWQKGFQMLAQGAGMVSIAFETSDQTIYEWGRDYRAGDQQGLVHRGVMFATYVASVTRAWTPANGWSTQITLGDPRAIESWSRAYARTLKSLVTLAQRIQTFIM